MGQPTDDPVGQGDLREERSSSDEKKGPLEATTQFETLYLLDKVLEEFFSFNLLI